LSNSRIPRKKIIDWLKDRLRVLEESEKRDYVVLKRGGLSDREIAEYRQTYRKYLEKLIRCPKLIPKVHEMEVASRIVVVGFKAK